MPHIGMGVNSSQTIGKRTSGDNLSVLRNVVTPLGGNVPSEISNDNMNNVTSCKTVKTAPEQDKAMSNYIKQNALLPASYNLYSSSCVDFVRDGIKAVLNVDLSNTMLPGVLYNEIN